MPESASTISNYAGNLKPVWCHRLFRRRSERLRHVDGQPGFFRVAEECRRFADHLERTVIRTRERARNRERAHAAPRRKGRHRELAEERGEIEPALASAKSRDRRDGF